MNIHDRMTSTIVAGTAGRNRGAAWLALLATVLALLAPPAAAQGFLQNFMRPHYLVPLVPLEGPINGGDLNATYQQILVPRLDNLELLIVGEYPRAQFFSITLYDDHGLIIGVLTDKDITPLVPGTQNPYAPGGPAGAEDVLYAVTVRLGNGLLETAVPACGLGALDAHGNLMDARQRHTAYDRYSCQQSNYSVNVPGFGLVTHDENPTNRALSIVIRQYVPKGPGPGSAFDLTNPLVWLRSTTTGCALPLAAPGTSVPPSGWLRVWQVVDYPQMLSHGFNEKALGFTVPHGPDPSNGVTWLGSQEFLLKSLPELYLTGAVPYDSSTYPNAPSQLNAQGRVLKLSFRLPRMPCTGFPTCGALSGSEELRYWSVSFAKPDGSTQATVSDKDLVADPNGYVTMIASFGTPLPPHVNAANGYSVVNLPIFNLARLDMRNIMPAETFECSTSNVPPRVAEHHPQGGYMGEYAPFATFPKAVDLPATAVPFPQVNQCQPTEPYVPPCP